MLLAWVFMVAALLIILSVPEAQGYEISPYTAFPSVVWMLILVAMGIGYSVAIVHVSLPSKSLSYPLAIGVVTFANLILLLLPIERGYTFYGRHDPLTQVGNILDIRNTGHIGRSNFYPMFHILSYAAGTITGTSIEGVRGWLPLAFFLGFQLWTYMLVRVVTKNPGAARLALVLASVPVYPILTTFTPSDTLFLFVPFILYLFFLTRRERSIKIQLLFVTILLVSPFSHPEVVLFLALVFISHDFTAALQRRKNRKVRFPKSADAFGALIIVVAAFFLWFSTFSAFGASLSRLRDSFLGETLLPSPIRLYESLFARSGFSVLTLLWVLFVLTGPRVVYVLVAIVAFVYVFRRRVHDASILALAIPVFVLLPITALTLVADTIIGYDRVLKYVVFASTVLVSVCYAKFPEAHLRSAHQQYDAGTVRGKLLGTSVSKGSAVVIGTCVLVAVMIAPFDLYSSPIIYYPNEQVTSTDFAGTFWFTVHGSERINTTDILVLGRYVHALFGYDTSLDDFPVFAAALYQTNRLPPVDFNYDLLQSGVKNKTAGVYLLIDSYSKSLYCDLFPEHGRFTCADFRRLGVYPWASLTYANGGFEVWYIQQTGP